MRRTLPPAKPMKLIYAQLPFVSASNSDEQHRTTIYTDGSAHCTCDGFRYRQTCRHEQALRRQYTAVEFAGSYAIALELSS